MVFAVGDTGCIVQILVKNSRLRIGESNHRGITTDSPLYKSLRVQVIAVQRLGRCLGYLPILTIKAAEVAPAGGQRENRLTGHEVEQGLLFNGIDTKRAGISLGGDIKCAGNHLPKEVFINGRYLKQYSNIFNISACLVCTRLFSSQNALTFFAGKFF